MNPRLLVLVIASLAMLNSCTKESFVPLSQEPLPGSVIEFIYEEEASSLQNANNNNRVLFVVPPPSVQQDCRNNIPSVIIPKMHNQTLEFTYAKNSNYSGSFSEKIKTLKWVVNGEEQLHMSSTLELPFEIGDVFNIELTVRFDDGSMQEVDFNFAASTNIETLRDGTIIYSSGLSAFNGTTISESCTAELSRAIGIVIVDIII